MLDSPEIEEYLYNKSCKISKRLRHGNEVDLLLGFAIH